jgi:hypothetical protein
MFVPYVLHTLAEEPSRIEEFLARDPDRLAACHETVLARRRWMQYLDAAGALTGKIVRVVVEGGTNPWTDCHVASVERSMNVVTECFVIVTGGGLRIPVSPKTEILMENSRA